MNKSCLLCGVGGQGTVLASKLIADAALKNGQRVHSAETIGMAQRGGSVVSHVRIGQDCYSPLIPEHMADVMIAFEPGEAVRCIAYLKDDGVMVVSNKEVAPVTASLSGSDYSGVEMLQFLQKQVKKLVVVDAEVVLEQLGSAKVLNVVLLGAACASGMLGVTLEDIEEALKLRLPEKLHALNIKALETGAKIAEGENS